MPIDGHDMHSHTQKDAYLTRWKIKSLGEYLLCKTKASAAYKVVIDRKCMANFIFIALCELKCSQLIIRESQKSEITTMLGLLVIANSLYKGIQWYSETIAVNKRPYGALYTQVEA